MINRNNRVTAQLAYSRLVRRNRLKRCVDIAVALSLVPLVLPLCGVIAVLVRLSSRGPALYWSDRVGKRNQIFRMPKFRSMHIDTPAVATHLLTNADKHITPLGKFLRSTSLDELPQLWSILRGEMSFVGPRPALFNQHDLIEARTGFGVHLMRPGLTGLAQISGRDHLSISEKVAFDAKYAATQSTREDIRILWATIAKVARRDGVRQADDEPTRRAA